MSYDGTLNFGLLGDYDALPDLDDLTAALRDAIAELAAAAGVPRANGRAPTRTRRRPARATKCGVSSAGCWSSCSPSRRWAAACCCCSRATTLGSRTAAGPGERVDATAARRARRP